MPCSGWPFQLPEAPFQLLEAGQVTLEVKGRSCPSLLVWNTPTTRFCGRGLDDLHPAQATAGLPPAASPRDGWDRGRVSPSHPLLVAPGIHTPAVIRTTGPSRALADRQNTGSPHPKDSTGRAQRSTEHGLGTGRAGRGLPRRVDLSFSHLAQQHPAITLSWGAGHFSPCPEARLVHLYPPASTRGSLASRLAEKWGH